MWKYWVAILTIVFHTGVGCCMGSHGNNSSGDDAQDLLEEMLGPRFDTVMEGENGTEVLTDDS